MYVDKLALEAKYVDLIILCHFRPHMLTLRLFLDHGQSNLSFLKAFSNVVFYVC